MHTHPRATELIYVIKGENLRVGFVEGTVAQYHIKKRVRCSGGQSADRHNLLHFVVQRVVEESLKTL